MLYRFNRTRGLWQYLSLFALNGPIWRSSAFGTRRYIPTDKGRTVLPDYDEEAGTYQRLVYRLGPPGPDFKGWQYSEDLIDWYDSSYNQPALSLGRTGPASRADIEREGLVVLDMAPEYMGYFEDARNAEIIAARQLAEKLAEEAQPINVRSIFREGEAPQPAEALNAEIAQSLSGDGPESEEEFDASDSPAFNRDLTQADLDAAFGPGVARGLVGTPNDDDEITPPEQYQWLSADSMMHDVRQMENGHVINAARLCDNWIPRHGAPMSDQRWQMCANANAEVQRRGLQKYAPNQKFEGVFTPVKEPHELEQPLLTREEIMALRRIIPGVMAVLQYDTPLIETPAGDLTIWEAMSLIGAAETALNNHGDDKVCRVAISKLDELLRTRLSVAFEDISNEYDPKGA